MNRKKTAEAAASDPLQHTEAQDSAGPAAVQAATESVIDLCESDDDAKLVIRKRLDYAEVANGTPPASAINDASSTVLDHSPQSSSKSNDSTAPLESSTSSETGDFRMTLPAKLGGGHHQQELERVDEALEAVAVGKKRQADDDKMSCDPQDRSPSIEIVAMASSAPQLKRKAVLHESPHITTRGLANVTSEPNSPAADRAARKRQKIVERQHTPLPKQTKAAIESSHASKNDDVHYATPKAKKIAAIGAQLVQALREECIPGSSDVNVEVPATKILDSIRSVIEEYDKELQKKAGTKDVHEAAVNAEQENIAVEQQEDNGDDSGEAADGSEDEMGRQSGNANHDSEELKATDEDGARPVASDREACSSIERLPRLSSEEYNAVLATRTPSPEPPVKLPTKHDLRAVVRNIIESEDAGKASGAPPSPPQGPRAQSRVRSFTKRQEDEAIKGMVKVLAKLFRKKRRDIAKRAVMLH